MNALRIQRHTFLNSIYQKYWSSIPLVWYIPNAILTVSHCNLCVFLIFLSMISITFVTEMNEIINMIGQSKCFHHRLIKQTNRVWIIYWILNSNLDKALVKIRLTSTIHTFSQIQRQFHQRKGIEKYSVVWFALCEWYIRVTTEVDHLL